MKIYLLTAGSYEDYRVLGVFSSREKANTEAIRHIKFPQYEADIEEFDLDPTLEPLRDFSKDKKSDDESGISDALPYLLASTWETKKQIMKNRITPYMKIIPAHKIIP